MNLFDLVLSRGRRMVALPGGAVAARLAGVSVGDAAREAEIQVRALRSFKERFGPDVVFTLMDLTVEAEALGLEVDFHPDCPPSLPRQDLPRLKRFLELEPPDPESAGRMPVLLRVLEELAGEDDVLWGTFATGPLTLIDRLAGEDGWPSQLNTEADLAEALGFATAVVGSYAAALGSRADLVVVVDPAAGELPERAFARHYRPYLKALFGIVRSAGSACFYHICGDVTRLLGDIGSAGAEGILLDPETEPSRAAEELPRNMLVMGNLDGERTVSRGSEDDVRWETRRALRSMRRHPNFILSTGCLLPADAPPVNIDVLVEETRNWKPLEGF
ncbi:uroporphyrinogen decarboxylase family protein [Candidatus Solincola sp.]|nr:uroporphyrinogen decarboxylase family protein [Actinomycetota bacterium]MDI7252521.1 uroporphyrinogen decarboxylase family protein [Actinomycetota bacterium]